MKKQRCEWAASSKLYQRYHDLEWGKPVYDDKVLFEFLLLESFQAGLSWITILKKRENFRDAFDNFDYNKIARYDHTKVHELLNNQEIIRHRLKIEAAIVNAKKFIETQKEYDSFSHYIWRFVGGQPQVNQWHLLEEVPVTTTVSDQMSKSLKKKGFKFVGPTIMYSYMQAVGMVNDHLITCPCHPDQN